MSALHPGGHVVRGNVTIERLLFLLSAAFFRVPFVQLVDDLVHYTRHGLEAPLSVSANSVGAFKRDHIAIPIGAFGAGRGLGSLDRYDFVELSHRARLLSDAPRRALFAG